MSKVTSDSAFEDSIEAHLLASGWLKGDSSGYDRGLGLDAAELVAFLEASQPDEWEQLTQRLPVLTLEAMGLRPDQGY